MVAECVRLGVDPETEHAVWVWWLEAPLATAVAALHAAGTTCPECAGALELARDGGALAILEDTRNVISMSDRCRACQAQLHFDVTPAARRPFLRWPKVAVGAPLELPRAGS